MRLHRHLVSNPYFEVAVGNFICLHMIEKLRNSETRSYMYT